MKIRLFLLSILLTFACYLARGQSAIDYSTLLHNYAQSEPALKKLINEEIDKQRFLNIDIIGSYSNLLYQVQENTFIQLALENREYIHLKLEYFNLQFDTPELEEEYRLQTTFAEFYPNRLLDFLEVKMNTTAPVSLELLETTHPHLLQGNFTESFNRIKNEDPILTEKVSGNGGSTIFINDVSLHHVRFPAAREDGNYECSWWHCTLSCMDIPYDFIEGLVFSVCSGFCTSIASPLGLTGIPEVGCLVCLGLATTAFSACAGQCSVDPCSYGYRCRPGTVKSESDAFCDGEGNRVVEICNCDGQGWSNMVQECPPGTSCQGRGICAPCEIRNTIPEAETPDQPELAPTGGLTENEDQGRAIYSCRTINISSDIRNESIPNAKDGQITVTASGGYGNFYYQWSNGETGQTLSDLYAGEYCVTVIDGRCCYEIKCFTVVEEACEGLEWNIVLDDQPACNITDGQISVNSITGAIPPYEYEWSNGSTSQLITNLEVGFYSVTVTDYYGCTGVSSVYLNGYDGADPNLDHTTIIYACPDDPKSGSIDLVVESSSIIFNYEWSNGAYTEDISELLPGNYSVTVTDQCGREYTENFDVGMLELGTDVTHTIDNYCQGSVLLSAVGGQGPFTFKIQGSTGTSSIETDLESHLFEGLCLGNYTVTVETADGCKITETINICICPGIDYEDWFFNENTNEYCREYSIPPSELCEAYQDQHCFTPIYGEFWYYNEDTDQFCRSVTCPDDAYCEDFTIYEQCFDPDYTDWEYDEDADQYCREATCTEYDFCEGLVINQCLDYEKGNCSFTNQDMCECEIIVNGEVILEETIEPEVEWDYDAENNECIKIFFCEGSEIAEDYIQPEETPDWEFNENNQTCYRVVICSEEDDAEFDQENNNPDIDWQYEEWSESCVAYIECDNDSDELEVTGDTDIEWEYDDNNDICIATVNCSFNGDAEEEWDFTTQAEGGDVVDAGLVDGEYRCILDWDCGNGAETGTTLGGLADCTESSGSDCIYTCDNISYEYDCLPQCDGLVGDNPSRNTTMQLGSVSFTQSPVAYPNPFKEEINIANLPIEEKGVRVELLDSRGALIKTMRSFNHTHLSINTSHLAKGIYFIRMYNMDRSFMKTEKVIKLR